MDAAYCTEVNGKRHLIVPYSFTHNDAKYVLPQGFSDPSSYFDTCRRGFDYLWEEGATLDDREPVPRVPPDLLLRDRRHADPVLRVRVHTARPSPAVRRSRARRVALERTPGDPHP